VTHALDDLHLSYFAAVTADGRRYLRHNEPQTIKLRKDEAEFKLLYSMQRTISRGDENPMETNF
jgi:hypothetical protein